MHSDLLERAQIARDHIDVPNFPLASIRSAAARSPKPAPHRRTIIASILAGLSVVAIAAAAEVMTQTQITFTPQGGMVISSDAKHSSRMNPTEADIRDAIAHLDFPAILPSGLPEGTVAKQLGTEGSDALYIRYDLPGAERQSHHMLYIFLANHNTITGRPASRNGSSSLYSLRMGDRGEFFRIGAAESVIVVSNGLTPAEFATIKASMQQAAQ